MRGVRATILGAGLLAAAGAAAEPGPTSRYSPIGIGGPDCKEAGGNVEGFACPGLGGWRVFLGFPAIGMTLVIGRVNGSEVPLLSPRDGRTLAIEGLPGARSSSVEWRGPERSGRFDPNAAIVRVTVLDAAQRQETLETAKSPAKPRRISVLLVYRLTRSGTCQVAYVDAGANPDANTLARRAADSALACPVDQVTVPGRRSAILDGAMQ